MTLPVTVPNQFANATSSIPLSQLDSNFNTLANVVNEINAGTQQLSNANVVTLIVTGNATIGDASSDTVTLNSTLTANTAVIFSAGTSAAPAITTTGDTNTGIFFPAADTIAFAEGGAEAMRIDSSGNVLVGTTTATKNLRVAEKFAVVSTSADSSGMALTGYSGTTAGNRPILDFNRSRGTTDGTMTVVASGDSLGSIVFRGSDGADFQDSSMIRGEVDATPGANDMPGRLTFWTAADGTTSLTERMRINSSGNVGIGVSSVFQTRLEVNGSLGRRYVTPGTTGSPAKEGGLLYTSGDAGGTINGGIYFFNSYSSSSANQIGFETMDANGTIAERMRIGPTGTIRFNAYGSGTLSTDANGVISASDGRYKTKTRPVENGLETIAALQPTYYKWDEDSPFASENEELGFIAQEVASVIPEASPGEDEEDKYRNYYDRAIIAMLVKAVQELKAITDTQAQTISALEARIAALETGE